MHISWLGDSCVKIQAKPFDKDVNIVIDPYKPEKGSFPRSLTPDIALYSAGEKGSITLSGKPFVLSTAGECETKGVLIASGRTDNPKKIIFRLDAEQISVGHLGYIDKEPSGATLEILNGVDVLMVPVGGKDCLDAEKAVKVVNTLEPRVVIPIVYQSENNPEYDKVDKFLKEIGHSNGKPEKKIILKKKDLPQEETDVIVLDKE